MEKLTIQKITHYDQEKGGSIIKDLLTNIKTHNGYLILSPVSFDFDKMEVSREVYSKEDYVVLKAEYKLPNSKKICREFKSNIEKMVTVSLAFILEVFQHGIEFGDIIDKASTLKIEDIEKIFKNVIKKRGEKTCVKQKKI